MIAVDQTQSWVDNHATLDQSDTANQGALWLTEQRRQALALFQDIGLPGLRDEEWRYTNLRTLKAHSLAISVSPTSAHLDIDLPTTAHPRLVFVDGFLQTDVSTALTLSGVTTLKTALSDNPDSLSAHFGQCLPTQQHGFTALNTAYAQDGYVINLANNQVLNETIEIVFVAQSEQSVSHSRNLIITGANTQCTVIERFIAAKKDGAEDAVYLNNTVTEIMAGENAHIDHYKIQQESDAAYHVGGVFIDQAKSSQVTTHNIALSGLITRNDVDTNLLGEGAHIEMNGLVLGKGKQHIDNHTTVNHAVANCTSDEYYKTVLDDHSRSVFKGRIIVALDAQQTNADQQNNNLLLSKFAEADTKPQLEIYADDVKCSHGATVGQLDASSLFYLKSRGINDESARGLLTFAFANEVVERVRVASIKQELTQLIAGELLSGLEELV